VRQLIRPSWSRPGAHQLSCTDGVARVCAPAPRFGVDLGVFRMRTLRWVVDGMAGTEGSDEQAAPGAEEGRSPPCCTPMRRRVPLPPAAPPSPACPRCRLLLMAGRAQTPALTGGAPVVHRLGSEGGPPAPPRDMWRGTKGHRWGRGRRPRRRRRQRPPVGRGRRASRRRRLWRHPWRSRCEYTWRRSPAAACPIGHVGRRASWTLYWTRQLTAVRCPQTAHAVDGAGAVRLGVAFSVIGEGRRGRLFLFGPDAASSGLVRQRDAAPPSSYDGRRASATLSVSFVACAV